MVTPYPFCPTTNGDSNVFRRETSVDVVVDPQFYVRKLLNDSVLDSFPDLLVGRGEGGSGIKLEMSYFTKTTH